MGPEMALGMARVFVELPKISLEIARISNDSGAHQLQCAILAVIQAGLLATMAEQSKGRTLSRTCVRQGHNPLKEVVRDFGLLGSGVFVAHRFSLGQGGSECSGGEPCM